MTPSPIRDEFRAMGCAVEVEVVGGDHHHLAAARRQIVHLERCWSRFLPDSDVSRLNAAHGATVAVDPSTIDLLEAMVRGVIATNGAFDPTLLAPLVDLGYGASWTGSGDATSLPAGAAWRGSMLGTAVDRHVSVAQLPVGTVIDAGGIGKGLAADRVTRELLTLGATGAMVSIGGDLRVAGQGPADGHWLIGVADAFDHETEVVQLALGSGGVATSGTLRRSWLDHRDRPVHHLLDPTTQRPLPIGDSEILQAPVVAGDAAWAEVYTKLVMVQGPSALRRLDSLGLGARVVFGDGSVADNNQWSAFAKDVACIRS